MLVVERRVQTTDFYFDLPPERIAQEPVAERTEARMLVLARASGAREHRRVRELPAFLRAGDLLVVNETRVWPARVFGRKVATGGRVEVLFVAPVGPDQWEAILGASRAPAVGAVLSLADDRLRAEVVARLDHGRFRLAIAAARPLPDLLEEIGLPPLPPYIRRAPDTDHAMTARDRERYQTVYARVPGAIAAPTAGLHFTPALLDTLAAQGVERAALTLHVGPGTFKPVKTERVEDHRMEAEWYEVPEETARRVNAARARGGRVVAVGSTVARTLETVAGEDGTVRAGQGRSALFIYPPYRFKTVDVLLTNFHLPASTLLMMVCAFAGRERVLAAYAEAVRERYRFYSYGDCMLLLDA